MESDSAREDLKARARAVYTKYNEFETFRVWTESEQETWRDINAMTPDERNKFDGEVWGIIHRYDQLKWKRVFDHLQANTEIILSGAPDDVLENLPTEPQGTFEEWFWARCRRLGIEEEFRAKFEEWKRNRA